MQHRLSTSRPLVFSSQAVPFFRGIRLKVNSEYFPDDAIPFSSSGSRPEGLTFRFEPLPEVRSVG